MEWHTPAWSFATSTNAKQQHRFMFGILFELGNPTTEGQNTLGGSSPIKDSLASPTSLVITAWN